jgi:predicted glutamine amidotransferase
LENQIISRERLAICAEANDDGCGLAYVENGEVKIYKTLSFANFYTVYDQQMQINPDRKFLIHFRIRTQGLVDSDNCHPFQIDAQHAFIHNGHIPKMPKCDTKSDTRIFNEQVLQQLPEGWMTNPGIHFLLEQSIGFSKLCVINHLNEVLVINEAAGEWADDGNWYSNKSYEARKKFTPVTNYYEGYSYHPRKEEFEDGKRIWWVGSQKRRYNGGNMQAYDYYLQMWRDIDLAGRWTFTAIEDKERQLAETTTLPPAKCQECETCDKAFPKKEMSLARYQGERKTFWMCQHCSDFLADYITLGSIEIVRVPKVIQHNLF